jgi:hypothetical protein
MQCMRVILSISVHTRAWSRLSNRLYPDGFRDISMQSVVPVSRNFRVGVHHGSSTSWTTWENEPASEPHGAILLDSVCRANTWTITCRAIVITAVGGLPHGQFDARDDERRLIDLALSTYQ